MVRVEYGRRADLKPLVWSGDVHVLTTGTTGAGKTSVANAIIWSLLKDNPGEHVGIICINPKVIGFEYFCVSPAVRVYDDTTQFESVVQAVKDEVSRRKTLLKENGYLPDGVGPLYLFVDELPSLVGKEGLLVSNAASRAIREGLLQILRTGRQMQTFVLSFTQFSDASSTGGSDARELYSGRICMRTENASSAAMATGLAESEISENTTSFLPGEVYCRTQMGTSFVRGWIDWKSERELAEAVKHLPEPTLPDFAFLDKRGL